MRLLSLFFAFYFACLSCLTCTDEVPVCKDQQQTSVATSHSDVGAGTLGDWCSPLCQCHCCGGAVVPVTLVNKAAYPQPTEWAAGPRHAPFVVTAPTRALGAVWQPPQA
ncbi:MAG: hypothetical protein M3Y12_02425 [Bacteroidota bacterium]|nr:hypothetical protein [Bacteroidota bacterium]